MKKYIISYNSENDFFCYDVNDRRCSRKQAAENFKMILTEISNTLLYLEKGNNCVIYFPKFKVEFKNYKEIIIKDNDICRLIYICRKKAKYRLNTLLAASVLLVAAGTSFVLSKDYKKSDVNTITSKTKVERPINIDEIDKSLISSVVEKTESKQKTAEEHWQI